MLQNLVSGVDDQDFEIEDALDKQLGTRPLPFPGMDKNKAALCEFFLNGTCTRGANCPYRHVRGERTIVCKHWLRHLCKKGDDCEFLHEYDMSKMPICYFFQKFGECNNRDCQYLHIDADSLRLKDCAWYDRGFCKHGPNCRNRHTRRVVCQNFMCGFCPEGPKCKFIHAKFETPVVNPAFNFIQTGTQALLFCERLGMRLTLPMMRIEKQSIASQLVIDIPAVSTVLAGLNPYSKPSGLHPRRPLDQVTCFKCGEKGHYANMCPKSFRAMQMGLVGTQQEIAMNVGVK